MKTERISRPDAAVAAGAAQPSSAKPAPAAGIRAPQTAAPARKPSTATRPGGAAEAEVEIQKRRNAYRAWHAFRLGFAVISWIVPAAFVAFFLLTAGVRPDLIEGSASFQFLRACVQPILSVTERWLPFRPVLAGWDFTLIGLAALAAFLRVALLIPLERWEHDAMLRAGIYPEG